MAPSPKTRSISQARGSVPVTPVNPKRIEEIEVILNRVVRANCCLLPSRPEKFETLVQAVGDGSDLFRDPSSKISRIRLKFLNNNFLQDVTEDFMLVQQLNRNIEKTIVFNEELFHSYEVYQREEMDLLYRLFQRFYYMTVERKHGYIKANESKVEISGKLLCKELELNPRILRMFGVISSFSEDAMVDWITFLRILSIFLLRRDVLQERLEFVFKLLKFKDDMSVLGQADYLQNTIQTFQFSTKHKTIVPTRQAQNYWNRLRFILFKRKESYFDVGFSNTFQVKRSAKEVAENYPEIIGETLKFFDFVFQIL